MELAKEAEQQNTSHILLYIQINFDGVKQKTLTLIFFLAGRNGLLVAKTICLKKNRSIQNIE